MHNPHRFVLFPTQDNEVWSMCKQAMASFWTVKEIDLAHNLVDWKDKLTSNDQCFISHVLTFFAASNGIVNKNLVQNFMAEVQSPEAWCFCGLQIAAKNVHSEMCSLLIDTCIKDPDEKARLFGAVEAIPCAQAKANWTLLWCNHKQATFAERLVALVAVKGMFFSGSFCATFWLKQ